MEDALSFDVVRWLVRRLPGKVEVVWKGYDGERALAANWPRFMPLLEEDGYVEANVPWRRWLATASRNKNAEWLVRQEGLLAEAAAASQLRKLRACPLVPSLSSWGREDKRALLKIIRAKSAANEMRYARLLQKHRRLREALLELGS